MMAGGMDLDIIVNPKVTDDGQPIIQVRFTQRRLEIISILYDQPSWRRLQARQ
jgi:hypothetical protein